MFPIRVKTVQESDLRMLGSLARNIQRVLPVTQADIDAAAALGKGWVVWKVFEVSDPLDNLRGGTQLIIRQNSVQPGQNVRRVIFVSGPGGQTVVIRGTDYIVLPDAIADSLTYVKAFGGTEQRNVPEGYVENQFVYMMDDSYLLTNIILEYGYRIEMDMQTTTTKATPATYLGASVGSDGIRFAHISNKKYRVIAFGDTTDSEGTISNNARIKYILTPERVTIYEDGVQELDYAYTATSTGTSIPLAINAYNSNGTIVAPGEEGIYLYSLKIWNTQNELVMDLVPATKLNPLTVGFYDRITGQHLTATVGTFAAGPEITPTPDAPIDIVSNNGAIAFRDTELPTAYRRILGMTMNNDCYYEITGFKMNGSDTLRFSFTRTGANACNVLGAYDGTSAQSNYSLYAGATSSASYLRYNGSTYNSYAVADKKYNVVLTPTGSDGMENDSTWTAKTFTSTTNLCIGTTSPSATSSKMVGSIHGSVVVDSRLELIPCERISDGELGYYDTYTGTFYEPIGTTPTSLGYDYTKCDIVAAGPVETIEDTIGNTATVEMLLKVGDYQDEQEILSGAVTRKVGVKVLDGTENWAFGGDVSSMFLLEEVVAPKSLTNRSVWCSHFKTTSSIPPIAERQNNYAVLSASGKISIGYADMNGSVNDFKAYLSAQYAAGTPVIVIYPLATPTTESVTGQPLQVTAGDNYLEITQASLTGLELEVEYQAAVSLTIQEVEDANLDNNVTVTIQ